MLLVYTIMFGCGLAIEDEFLIVYGISEHGLNQIYVSRWMNAHGLSFVIYCQFGMQNYGFLF